MNNNQVDASAKKQCKIADIIIGLLFFAGFIVLAFIPEYIKGSDFTLFDGIKDVFKNFKNISAFGHTGISFLCLVVFYAVSLVLTVLSFFFSKKAARAFNYVKAFLALAVFTNLIVSLYNEFGGYNPGVIKGLLNINSIIFALGASVLYLIVLNFMQFKKAGFVKLLLFILAFGFIAFYNFAFIGTLKLENLWDIKLKLGSGIVNTIATYAYLALGFGILANLLLAVLGFVIKKTGVMDYIRTIALFIIAVVCFVLLAIDTKFTNIEDYLGTILSLALSAVSCFAVIIIGSVKKRKAKQAAAAENFVFDGDQMAIKGLEAPSAAATEQSETAETATALDDAAQISIDEIAENQATEEVASAEAVEESAEPATEPVEEMTEEVQGEPVEKPFNFEQAQYDGKYNREYAEFAEREEARQAQQEQQAQQPYQQAPYVSGQGYAQQFAQTYGVPYYNGPAAVLPDSFINGLTPAEKDEFDKLFISRIYGDNKRLPMYRVGGDNREFFSKVFVFIGRYRNIISDGLLEKIYTQSNLLK